MGFMVLFWIAVVIGIVYLVRYLVTRPSGDRPVRSGVPRTVKPEDPKQPSQGKSDALRIRRGTVRPGEIDQEEFLRRKADLIS